MECPNEGSEWFEEEPDKLCGEFDLDLSGELTKDLFMSKFVRAEVVVELFGLGKVVLWGIGSSWASKVMLSSEEDEPDELPKRGSSENACRAILIAKNPLRKGKNGDW